MTNNIEKFKSITREMAELYERKNHDYGNSFDESCNKHGLIAAVVRMEDKLNRAATLINKDTMVKSESIKDTLTDLANYAIMARMWLEGKEDSEDFRTEIDNYSTEIVGGGVYLPGTQKEVNLMCFECKETDHCAFLKSYFSEGECHFSPKRESRHYKIKQD